MSIRPVKVLFVCALVSLVVSAPALALRTVKSVELSLRSEGFYAGSGPLAASIAAASAHRSLGDRALHLGTTGWDVAELELALAWQGFPSGTIDGRFAPPTLAALGRFQRAVGLPTDGVAGVATIAALRKDPVRAAIPLVWPVFGLLGDGFGPRGTRFHSGIDLIAPAGTPVIAAAPGRVTWAGPRPGGWGNLVTVSHGHGVRTMYAHLSRVKAEVGEWVAGGAMLGRVGATGDATGPHLHFEVRVGGAAIDPLSALVPLPADAAWAQSG